MKIRKKGKQMSKVTTPPPEPVYRYVPLHKSNPGTELYLRAACDRVAAFAEKYDPEANPDILYPLLVSSYLEATGMSLLLILRDAELIGHCLLVVEDYYGTRSLNVNQYELDESIPDEIAKQGIADIAKNAARVGATKVRIQARNKRVARLFRTRYGFREAVKVPMWLPAKS